MTEMVLLGGGGEKTVIVKVFLAGGCREVLLIKDEVGSVDGFGREATLGVLCKNTAWEGSRV